jgi:hypothetical protein
MQQIDELLVAHPQGYPQASKGCVYGGFEQHATQTAVHAGLTYTAAAKAALDRIESRALASRATPFD